MDQELRIWTDVGNMDIGHRHMEQNGGGEREVGESERDGNGY